MMKLIVAGGVDELSNFLITFSPMDISIFFQHLLHNAIHKAWNPLPTAINSFPNSTLKHHIKAL